MGEIPKPHPLALRNGRPLRILHAPWNVAGQSAQLAAAERALGADSRCVVIHETAKGFPADEVLSPPNSSVLQREFARMQLLWRATRWADVIHFSFGQSCLVPNIFPDLSRINWSNPSSIAWQLYSRAVWLKDLPLLSALGKTLAVTWQGDDARQHDRSLELFNISIAGSLGSGYYPLGSDAWKRRSIEAFSKYVPIHYALNPDLLHVLPGCARFIPYMSFDPRVIQAVPPNADLSSPLIFGHAPSHRGAKGTEHVIKAAEVLRSEGLLFELRLIENLSRPQALLAYAECDLMIDQLLAGWYGGLGLEAMALAKPVIAYLRESDMGFLPAAMRRELPIVTATPNSIARVMRELLLMPRVSLHALGCASRQFALRWHDPIRIASRTLRDYQQAASHGVV